MDTRFTFTLEVEQHDKLRRISFETRRPIAEILREAINNYLKKEFKYEVK